MAGLSTYGVPVTLLTVLGALVFTTTTAATIDSFRDWPGADVLRFFHNDSSEAVQERASGAAPARFDLIIEVTRSLHITGPRYLSVTISGGQMSRGLEGFDFKLQKLMNLASGLRPAFVRFGGTLADFFIFDPTGSRPKRSADDFPSDVEENYEEEDSWDEKDSWDEEEESDEDLQDSSDSDVSRSRRKVGKKRMPRQFIVTGERWDNITRFTDAAGWDIKWDLNLLHFKKGRWDPTYAKKFLKYSASRGVRIPALQLGNEPNLYKTKFGMDIDGRRLAEDFWTLKNTVAEMPQFASSGLYGPDVTNLDHHKSARTYLQQFLKNGGCSSVTEVSIHHYYLQGDEAKLRDFTDPATLDGLKTVLETAYDIIAANCVMNKPLRLSETSSCTGGGIEGVTNAFIAGFLWLDKLGLSATYRVTHVFRQTFFASGYALISRDIEPYPDYYLSVIYKRLVEGPVFKVITAGMSPLVRVYAHCVSKRYYRYPDGALVVYYLNMAREETRLTASQFQSLGSSNSLELDLYIFTPGDHDGLLSKKVKLNGKLLEMNGARLPTMNGLSHVGDVPLNPQSYGFVVIPYADVPLCRQYHRAERP